MPYSEEEQYHLDQAALGKQLDEFWDSRVGQYLLEMSLAQYNRALEDFKTCDPTDYKTVARLQADIRHAESFKDWLNRGIENGLKSTNILQGNDDEIP